MFSHREIFTMFLLFVSPSNQSMVELWEDVGFLQPNQTCPSYGSCSSCNTHSGCIWCSDAKKCADQESAYHTCSPSEQHSKCDDTYYTIVFISVFCFLAVLCCGICYFKKFRRDRLGSPRSLFISSSARDQIFRDSIFTDGEMEWMCIICGFDNHPKNSFCSMCGTSHQFSTDYKDNKQKKQKSKLLNRKNEYIHSFNPEVSQQHALALTSALWSSPSRSFDNRSSTSLDLKENGTHGQLSSVSMSYRSFLSPERVQEAVNYRRMNQLSLRQKSARRRKMWQRILDLETQQFHWKRVSVGSVVVKNAPFGYTPEHSLRRNKSADENEIDEDGDDIDFKYCDDENECDNYREYEDIENDISGSNTGRLLGNYTSKSKSNPQSSRSWWTAFLSWFTPSAYSYSRLSNSDDSRHSFFQSSLAYEDMDNKPTSVDRCSNDQPTTLENDPYAALISALHHSDSVSDPLSRNESATANFDIPSNFYTQNISQPDHDSLISPMHGSKNFTGLPNHRKTSTDSFGDEVILSSSPGFVSIFKSANSGLEWVKVPCGAAAPPSHPEVDRKELQRLIPYVSWRVPNSSILTSQTEASNGGLNMAGIENNQLEETVPLPPISSPRSPVSRHRRAHSSISSASSHDFVWRRTSEASQYHTMLIDINDPYAQYEAMHGAISSDLLVPSADNCQEEPQNEEPSRSDDQCVPISEERIPNEKVESVEPQNDSVIGEELGISKSSPNDEVINQRTDVENLVININSSCYSSSDNSYSQMEVDNTDVNGNNTNNYYSNGNDDSNHSITNEVIHSDNVGHGDSVAVDIEPFSSQVCCTPQRPDCSSYFHCNYYEYFGSGLGNTIEERMFFDDLETLASLTFREKQLWCLDRMADLQRPHADGSIRLEVRRSRLLEDSVATFGRLDSTELHKWLRIQFVGEPGIDAGGLEREWFELVTQALLDPSLGLFLCTSSDECSGVYHINPLSDFSPLTMAATMKCNHFTNDVRHRAMTSENLGQSSQRNENTISNKSDCGNERSPQDNSVSLENSLITSQTINNDGKVDQQVPCGWRASSSTLRAEYFRFAGRLIGKAILEQQPIPLTLSLPLRKQILNIPITFSDLEFVDATIYQSLKWVQQNYGVEMLGLDFSVSYEYDGHRRTWELLPQGLQIAVTDENKQEYLMLRMKHMLLDSVRIQLEQLLIGLYEVIPPAVLSIFDYQELELLMCGIPEIDVEDWKRYTEYLGEFHVKGKEHRVIGWFWKCVEKMCHEERIRLLQFVTGSSRLPAQGFKALQSSDGNYRRFNIQSVSRKESLFPRAHTCFNKLDLPVYKSMEELDAKLSFVIHADITGFSME